MTEQQIENEINEKGLHAPKLTPKAVHTVAKTLGNTCANGTRTNVKDVVFWGDGDNFKLISKASSEKEGWMKSTKAMQCGNSVVVQVTTQQRNLDGSYAVAEALTTVENSIITETRKDGVVVSRQIETNGEKVMNEQQA